jgi:trehalose-6-phosphate synthase
LDVDRILSEVSEGKTLHYNLGVESLYDKLTADRKGKRHIFGGLERCDYTKGLTERLAIFSHARNRLKSINRDARFYQITAPSRSDNPEYRYLDTVLREEVARINGRLPGEPVIHIDEGIPVPENYRFMKEVDVMLVTPLEDGMNLVAFEYILSQKYRKPHERGILVLGTSGASRVLREKGFGEKDGVIYANSMKAKDAGEKIVEAIGRERHLSAELIDHVERERRVDEWARDNIEAILNCRKVA